ncbi:MAG: hypothetical protein PVJ73_04850 [Acidobacteriota bacterium]|jgi:hypothetical protein|nr:hypothetical protein [Acidobacteriota bacterium]
MRIRYREAGGFAGISRGVDIDTATLPEDEAHDVGALVEAATPRGLQREGPPEARDLRGYEIVIEHDDGRTVLRFDDATIPAAVESLLAYLQDRARPRPPE